MKIPEILMVETVHQPGSLARVLGVIAEAGLIIDHLNAVRREQGRTLWEITLEMDEETDRSLYGRIDALSTARFVGKSDRVFDRHRGGKLRVSPSIIAWSRMFAFGAASTTFQTAPSSSGSTRTRSPASVSVTRPSPRDRGPSPGSPR